MADNTFTIQVVVKDGGGTKLAEQSVTRLGAAVEGAGKKHRSAKKDAADFFDTQAKGIIGTGNSTKSFSKLAETIGKGGSGSLVGAYATLAANVFAVTAAFGALRGAAQVEQIFRGLEAAGTRTGLSLISTSNALKEVTGNAIGTEQAMRSTAQIVSAGFDSKTVERLGQAARDTSFALGRNMTDSLDRLSRGIVKLEPELLDELGLMTKLTESNVNYARQLGKSESQLTGFEKRVGFSNAVLAEAELKFGGLSKAAGDSQAYDQLSSKFKDLSNELFNFLNLAGKPIAGLLSADMSTLAGVAILFASTLKNQLLPGLANSAVRLQGVATASKEAAAKKLELVKTYRAEAQALNASNLAAKENVVFAGTKLPAVYAAQRAEILKTIGTVGQLDKAQQKGMNSLASSIRISRTIVAQNPKFAKGTVDGDAKRTELAALIREQRAVEALGATRRAAATFDADNEAKVATARRAAAAARSAASSADAAAASVGAASQLKLGESWKQLTLSTRAYARAQALAGAEGITVMGRLRVALFATSTAAKALGTAFLTILPYIGLIVVAFGLLKTGYEALKSDATKRLEKAMISLAEATNKASDFAGELERVNNSQATASQRAAAALTIQANAVREATEKYTEFAEAFRNKNVDDNLFSKDTENRVAGFWETLGQRSALSYSLGLKKNSRALDLAEVVESKGLLGGRSGQLAEGVKEAVAQFNTLDSVNKKGLDSVLKSRGGFEGLKKTLKGLSSTEVVTYLEKVSKEVDSLTTGNEDNVKTFQESFKDLGNTLSDFARTSIPTTPYDTLVKSFKSAENAAAQLKKTIDPAQFSALLSGLDGSSVRALNVDTRLDVEQYNAADAIVQKLKALRKELEGQGSSLNVTDTLRLNNAQAVLDNNKNLGREIAVQITQRSNLVKQGQEEERLSKSQLALLNAQMQANSRIYTLGAAGLKARFAAEDRSRALQVKALQTQIDITTALSGNVKARIASLEVQKKELEASKLTLSSINDERRARALALQDAARLNLQQQNIGENEALQKTRGGALPVYDGMNSADRARNQAMNTWKTIDTIISSTLDKTGLMADKDKEIAAIEGIITTAKAESVDTMQQIAALQTQIQTIMTASLDPQQRSAELAKAQQQYYAQLLGSLGEQAKAAGELDDMYNNMDATLAGINDTLEYQVSQIKARATLEKDEIGRNRAAAISELTANLGIAQADLANKKRLSNKLDIEAAEAGVKFQQNSLDIAESNYDLSLLTTEQNERQAVLEKIIFDTRKDGLQWQQDALNYTSKMLDTQKSLSDEIQRGYELRLRLDAKKNGRELSVAGEEAIAINAARAAFEFAKQEASVKKGLIDLEYALLDAQKEALQEDLRARRDNLDSSDPRNTVRIAQLDSTISRLENIDLSKAAETAKAALDKSVENASLELQTAITRTPMPGAFAEMASTMQGIADRAEQREKARQELMKPIVSDNVKIVKPETAEERKQNAEIRNPLISVNRDLIAKITEWITIVKSVQALQAPAQDLPTGSVSSTASAITKQVIEFFVSKGYTLNQAAGIAGNFQQESSMDPHNINKDSGMAGLAQFSKRNQAEFVKQFGHGIAQSTVEEQLKFINDQLNGTEGAAKRLLLSADSIAEAAVAFRKGYERPKESEARDSKRIAAAEAAVSRSGPVAAVQATVPVTGGVINGPDIEVRANREEKLSDMRGASVLDAANDNNIVAGPDPVLQSLKKAPKDYSAITDTIDSFDALTKKTVADLAALGPDGEAVAAVVSGMTSVGNAAIEAFKTLDTNSIGSAKGFMAIAAVAQAALSVVQSVTAASAQAKEDAIQREIDAETKRDGKSAESIAKIASMEKKKDEIARKAFNANKKIMMAQALISTATGVALALSSAPPPFSFGLAAAVGALGAAQLAIISGTSYQSTSSAASAASTPATLSIGKRGDTVDLAKQNTNVGGELGYLRGKQGTGSNSSNYSVVGSAYGGGLGRGYGNTAYAIGEKGPEILTPDTPVTITPMNDNQKSNNPVQATFNIHALDASGVEEVLNNQKGNLINMFREAANANGQNFMEDVNTNTYSRPNKTGNSRL